MRAMVALVMAAWLSAQAQNFHVMFVGLDKGQNATFTKRFGENVRDRLKVMNGVSLVDYAETERLVDKVGLRQFPTVSHELVRSLQRFSADSTLIVWGRVKSYTVEAKRAGIFGATAVGNVSVVLTLYSLSADKYMFVGNANGTAKVRQGPVWFRRAAQVTHISAQDKEKIADDLSAETAERTTRMIAAVVRSLLETEGPRPMPAPAVEDEKEPSLYDVFEIPSAEPPPVEEAQPAPEGEAPKEEPEAAPELPTLEDMPFPEPAEDAPASTTEEEAPAPEMEELPLPEF